MKKYLLPFALVVLFASCTKNEDGGTTVWSTTTYGADLQSLYNPIQPIEQSFTINTADADTIITAGGIRFIIPNLAFLGDSSLATIGDVHVKIHEYFTNAQLLSGGMGTATTNGKLLITGGAFNITATDSAGYNLRLAKLINVSIPDNGHFDNTHKLFTRGYSNLVPSGINDPNIVNWAEDRTEWKQRQHGAGSFYDFSLYQLNWWNLDRFADRGQGTTALNVTLPATFGNTNTIVVLLTPENGLVRLYGDPSSQTFTTGTGYTIPVGLPVKILSIANKSGQYSYDLRSLTIAAGQTVAVNDMQAISEADLRAVIQTQLN